MADGAPDLKLLSFKKHDEMLLHDTDRIIFSLGCNSAGGHYNPFNLTHGGSNDVIR